MKIFVSHALTDQDLIKEVKNTLEPHGITLFIAEHYQDLKLSITQKIENMIKQCDVALILLTKNGYNSQFVQQEIGYIKSCQKPSLQVVQIGLEKKITGFIYGHDYITHDPTQPQATLEAIKRSLLSYWRKVEKKRIEKQEAIIFRQRELEVIRLENERKANEAKIGIGILAGLLVLGITSSK